MKKGLISDADLIVFQIRIEGMHLPTYMVEFHTKLLLRCQVLPHINLKVGTNYFSLVCLKDILPGNALY